MRSLPLWLAPLGLMLGLGGWLMRPSPSVTVEASPPPATPRYALSGARWLRLDQQGQPQFRLKAAQIDLYDDGSARLQQLSADALGGLDSPWVLRAPTGLMPAGHKRLRLDGPITGEGRLSADEPVTLVAEQLWLDYARRELSSDRPLRLTSPRKQASARGLRADFRARRIELRGDVEARYAPD